MVYSAMHLKLCDIYLFIYLYKYIYLFIYVPPRLTQKFLHFDHLIFYVFLWISVQKAIIYISSIEWLVFMLEAHGVICEVRIGLHTLM